MEQTRTEHDGWDRWDAVPRDGPAVFIVDTDAWSKGIVKGRWCNPWAPAEQVREQLTELLGHEPADDEWAIVDQVGLGPLMMSESPTVTRLADEALATYPEQTGGGVE
jgi:hypothetical protein